ncbi:MAG: transcriptional regulator [Thermoprotei archaeon]|nr:transcriptional regulator [Thermoprotei archaeon]
MRLDRLLGIFLFTGGLLLSCGYTWLLFFSHLERLKWWAIAIPVYFIILAMAFVAAWIGWIMVTTPPPKPLGDVTEEMREKLEKLRKELEQ